MPRKTHDRSWIRPKPPARVRKSKVTEDDALKDIPKMIEAEGAFSVKFSPFAGDETCKMTIGRIDVLLTTEQMKAIVKEL